MRQPGPYNHFGNEIDYREGVTVRQWVMAAISTTIVAMSGAQAKSAPEYAAIAAAGDGQKIVMTGVPMWQSGSFRLGNDGTIGRVRRRSHASGAPSLVDPTATDPDGLHAVERAGTMRFSISGPSVNGELTGECGFDRREERLVAGSVTWADPVAPLALDCRFWRQGQPVGGLRLDGVRQRSGLAPRTERVGEVWAGDIRLRIRSLHRTGHLGIKSDRPLGYAFAQDGRDVGALDLTPMSRRKIALPAATSQRDVVMAGAMALALFWDPGDTDD